MLSSGKYNVRRRLTALNEPGRWTNPDVTRLPFETVFSLAPLIDYWRSKAASGDSEDRQIFERIEEDLQSNPWLYESIEYPSQLNEYQDFVALLMKAVLGRSSEQEEAVAAVVPFQFRAFYATTPVKEILDEEGQISGRINLDARTLLQNSTLSAYLHILRSVFQIDVPYEYPVILSIRDSETGLDRHLKLISNQTFTRVEGLKELKLIPEDLKMQLLADPANMELWERTIPSSDFQISGVEILHMVDVTDEQVISQLKGDLLEKQQANLKALFPALVKRIRTYLRKPDIEVGLCALDGSQVFRIHRPDVEKDCLFSESGSYELSQLDGSPFARCVEDGSVQLIDDLSQQPNLSAVEGTMLEEGIRSVVAAPLFYEGELIGLFYVWSDQPYGLNGFDVMKLLEVLPLCAAAVQRSREELQNRIQAVILEQYTAIHSSVEWRFREAALDYIRQQEEGKIPEVAPIIFEDVYPLYAAADIRASSTHRNEAVQYDLIDHLNEAADVLTLVLKHKPLPIIHHLITRIDQYRSTLQKGLSSGDEGNVKDFIKRNIEPLLNHFRAFDPEVNDRIDRYWAAMEPGKGTLYSRCYAFDESVERVNRTITLYLMTEEQKAQAMFPHYFEKHETDGVEFSIYVGASLIKNGEYNPIYVKNLRLWQLMVMCGIARRVEPLKNTLKVPLEVTYLVLSQSSPLTIRFQLDETRFDVDGTYDIRYEIMKRRIDKAVLKGKTERLTQPGKIAIVYSQPREAREYLEYISFLQASGYLMEKVEEVELEDLQGMAGLKALRVTVAGGSGDTSDGIAPDMIERAVQNMPEAV